ncbi:MAG: hypothetical protein ACYCVD_07095 [Desulfitobacteriaceae bacterium]
MGTDFGKIVMSGSGFVGTPKKAKGEAMDLSHGLPFIHSIELFFLGILTTD